jgi:hypothetical protein
MTTVFAVVFSALVLVAILSVCSDVVMRVHLTRRESSAEKLAWWRRGSTRVADTYHELFPDSHLPLFSALTLWLLAALCVVGLMMFLSNPHSL